MDASAVQVSIVAAMASGGPLPKLCFEGAAAQSLPGFEFIAAVAEGAVLPPFPDPIADKCRTVRCNTADTAALLNAGCKEARGRFLLTINDAHILEPNALEVMAAHLEQFDSCAACYSSHRLVHRYGKTLLRPGMVRTCGPYDRNKALYRDFLPFAVMFRRELWQDAAQFRTGVVAPIWEFWTALMSRGIEPDYIARPLLTVVRPTHESDNLEQYSRLRALAQTVSFNPSLYSPQMVAWANGAARTPASALSYVIVAGTPLEHAGDAGKRLADTARSLASQGEAVAVLEPSQCQMEMKEGVQYLALPDASPDAVQQYTAQLGDRIVLIGLNLPSVLISAKSIPNVVLRVLVDDARCREEISDAFKAIDLIVCDSGSVGWWLKAGAGAADLLVLDRSGSNTEPESVELPLLIDSTAQSREIAMQTALHMSCEQTGSLASRLHCRALRGSIESSTKRRNQAAALESLRSREDYSVSGKGVDPALFSVVIPCRNVDAARLRRNLASIRGQRSFPELEIVLSDFGSDAVHADELNKLAADFNCVIARTDTQGPWSRSAALNRGIRQASRSWIATTDADMIFAADFFEMAYSYIEALGCNSIFYAQPIKLPPLDLPLDWQMNDYDAIAGLGRIFGEQGRGGCQIVQRAWLERVRGFNEAYLVWGNEDDDMFDRAGWDGLDRIWLRPGRYLHQWHMPNIYQAARDENRAQHQALRSAPRIVVNGDEWGIPKADTAELLQKRPPHTGRPVSELQREIIALGRDTKRQAELLAQHGRQALQNGQLDAALELLEDSAHLAADDPAVLLSLAEVYIKIGQVEFAVVNIDRAIELHPGFEPALRAREVLRTV